MIITVDNFFNFLCSVHFFGIFCAIVGCESYMYRFNRKRFKKEWGGFLLAISVPVVNFRMMWEGLKLYDKYVHGDVPDYEDCD